MASKVVVITGANRGIGRTVLERLLAESPQYSVIMTARTPEEGSAAYNEILHRGDYASRLQFHPLELNSRQSVSAFRDYLSNTVRQIDILVNNAGINAGKSWTDPDFDERIALDNVTTNFLSTVELTQALFPLIKSTGHIIFVSSKLGQLNMIPGAGLRSRLASDRLTTSEALGIAQEFLQSVRDNSYAQKGWPRDSYIVSKGLLNAYIRAFNRELRSAGNTIRVNALCPGWTRSDLGGPMAGQSLAQGADTPLSVIRYEGDQSGTFWQNRQISHW